MKKLFLLSLLLFLVVLSHADIVSKNDARKVCVNFYSYQKSILYDTKITEVIPATEYDVMHLGVPVYYIFNFKKDLGFVIVSAESNTFPILAYSFESSWDFNNISPGLKIITDNYIEQINNIRTNNLLAEKNISELWIKYLNNSFSREPLISVSPMLTTKWGQGCYYNSLCPADAAATGYCYHAVVGCLPLAMAQVMKYHKHPASGTGSNTYTYGSYGSITANFASTTYNWNSMPDILTSSNNSVATICFHTGVSVSAMYGPSGTPADFYNSVYAFKTYFKFKNTITLASKSAYTDASWAALLKADLDLGHPVIYIATDPSNGGHGMVVDGYQGSGGSSDHFHINWGWDGWEDGYFLLNDLTPGNYNFTQNIKAIVHIEPQTTSVNENLSNDIAYIFPNPVNKHFVVKLPETNKSEKVDLSLYDIDGRKVFSKDFSGLNVYYVENCGLNSGTYFYRIVSGLDHIYTGKIVVVE
jgi:hypothetical protein